MTDDETFEEPTDDPSTQPRRRIEPPTGMTLVALVVALCFLAGVVGWTVGRGRPPVRDSVDVGFLYDMVHHHNQAVAMSQTELFRGEVRDVKTFAEEIHRFQSYEIGLMDRMLDEWGYAIEDPPEVAMAWMDHPVDPDEMPGMATADELDRLRAATGTDPDTLFLALMADHHAGAVEMAETAAREADDAEVRALAKRMAAAQRFEIRELLGAAGRAGLDTTPPGMTVDLYDPDTGALVTTSTLHTEH